MRAFKKTIDYFCKKYYNPFILLGKEGTRQYYLHMSHLFFKEEKMKEEAHLVTMSLEDEVIDRILNIAQHRVGRRPISWLFPNAESVDALYEGSHGDDEDPGIWVNCTRI